MATFPLDKYLVGHAFGFVMIFSRVGSVLMLMPGIGEAFVAPRFRLMLAFAVSLLMLEPMLARLPAPPETISGLTHDIGYEVIIGLFFGTLLRLLMNVLETTGMVVGLQSGLSNATVLNPAMASQSPLPSAMLSVIGIVMVFVTGLDRLLFYSLAGIYDVFPAGGSIMSGDMAQTMIQSVNKSFVLGVELAMPFFVMGLLMYIAAGILQKLMPQVQLFMVLLPVQIWGGLTLLSITTAGIMTLWLHYFDTSVGAFIGK